MHTNIDPDDLVVPALYKLYTEKQWPVDEATVEKCLDPSRPFHSNKTSRYAQPSHEQMIAIMHSSILHVISAKETTAVLQSAEDYPMPELPPLPFPRIAIEAEETSGWIVSTGEGHRYSVYAIFISEREQGRVWDCMWYWGDCDNLERPYNDDEQYIPYIAWTIRATDGEGFQVVSAWQDDDEIVDSHISYAAARILTKFAIELTQIISADRVPHIPIKHVSRQQRRQWQSKHPYIITTDKPRVYYVNLNAAGETSHEEGDGSRVFHVRWLVRGHWRHMKGGRTKDGKRVFAKKTTWVKAHVRGPVGAPWKGRPIYRDEGDE